MFDVETEFGPRPAHASKPMIGGPAQASSPDSDLHTRRTTRVVIALILRAEEQARAARAPDFSYRLEATPEQTRIT